MKNPHSNYRVRAFLVTFTATSASPVNATESTSLATKNETRFRWCDQSNSVVPLIIQGGRITHDREFL